MMRYQFGGLIPFYLNRYRPIVQALLNSLRFVIAIDKSEY